MFLFNSCDAVVKSCFLVGWQASCPYQQSCLLKACRESVHDHAMCCSVPCLFFALASWICRGQFLHSHVYTYNIRIHAWQSTSTNASYHDCIIVHSHVESLVPLQKQWLFALIESGSKLWANSSFRLPNLDSSQSFLGNSVWRCPGTILGTIWPTGRA